MASVDDLYQRAVQSTDVSFTIADPYQPDTPLTWVNDAFTRVTGYPFAEAVGRNCRFLQGPRSDPAAAARLRDAQRERRPTRVEILNYRKDGSTFWNEIALAPVFDRAGRLTHFVGVQDDVTAKVEAREQREELLVREQRARSTAEWAARVEGAARGRLELLGQVTDAMSGALRQMPAAPRALADVLVPRLADLAVVDLAVVDDESYRIALVGLDSGLEADFIAGEAARGLPDTAWGLIDHVLSTGRPVLVSEVRDDDLVLAATSTAQLDAYRRMRPCSFLAVPLPARGRAVGVLRLITTAASGRHYDQDDQDLAVDLGRRAGMLLDNARLYRRAHTVAETLQRSLLPDMPTVPGMSLAARYLPASDTARVGGDWYDVLLLPDGRVGLVIGDVMGHDLPAAATMAQLRSMLRAYAWELVGPGEVLDRLDRLAQGFDTDSFATVFYAVLEQDPAGGGARLSYANAGHLPPLVCTGGGAGQRTVRPLADASSLPLGVGDAGGRDEASVPLPLGSTLLLYTDGLVEQRGRDIEEGIDQAAALLAGHLPGLVSRRAGVAHAAAAGADAGAARPDLDRLADALTSQVPAAESQQDDIAVLLVHLDGPAPT
ncbi:SpoIIE family protein phosphatase [Pseudofrankia asymbiotica]|uniref:Histidine kinase n=1 Tax=Pseudofrankia asymbiotica TaxID=1834516 RepID=A0A1V2IH25_9ACTN|nr:SpoIIE family protein phosphatase [Pseudofrankia asymbiotica]ONH32474.1 histidine kinase [Pseudofrankia asymbiotica]